ncbi:hypothetical protein KFL_005880060 [Klebsormidium nitens]|uniref:Uncharacterized protein n=1 Tax=Klebsormidium nitens TaxID=105231 RepID=A0A1Y1IIS7_KLENI|nr:hypothetical protein KFL_005880060 [Klebsormidium nitens]|eukprot:GAQ90002.1 hypothetical protein KFL_005880060 [Klebsormidium nitens]
MPEWSKAAQVKDGADYHRPLPELGGRAWSTRRQWICRAKARPTYKGKHPKTPQLLLLRPLVRALQRGGLHNELEAVWKTYKIGSLVYKHPSHILHRLVSALTFLARKDEVGVIASELIQVDQPIFDNNSVVLTLASLIEAGFETEAQRLADLQFEKHGVRLDVALESKISQKHTDCLGGVKSYELLLKLEGPHRASLPVQAALILHCYFPIKQTDKMWEAYQLGKGFDGNFDTTVMRYMLYELTAADRIANAEEVLEDYYRIRRDSRNRLEELGDGVFTSLFEMYMRDGRPQKVVDMVRQTVEEGYRIKRSVVNFWGMSVRKAGFRNEAKQIDIAIGERKGRRRLQPWKKQEARALGAAMRGRESS